MQTTWERIVDVMSSHYIKILGIEVPPNEVALLKVFEAHTKVIPKATREAMELPITLEELHKVAKAMAKKRVPGKDGLSMEIFRALWDQVGPLLLKVPQIGIPKGTLHSQLMKGIMVMLEKRGDQTLIDNKRGFTLLNYVLKILAKLYQLRLTIVLQSFIIEEQSACLLGRSIHCTLFLTNEILQRAKEMDLNIVLLKLDIIKAFDCMNWNFMYCLFQKIGFGPNFLRII